MCIICTDADIGQEYLDNMDRARASLKKCEAALLKLAKIDPSLSYDRAHKKLVRIRKELGQVGKIREITNTKPKP